MTLEVQVEKQQWIEIPDKEAIENKHSECFFTPERIIHFGDLIRDYNLIHRSTEAARKFGFKETPVIGVHLDSIAGEISQDILESLRKSSPLLNSLGQLTEFKKPLYPFTIPQWKIREVKYTPDGKEIRAKIESIFNDEVKTITEAYFGENTAFTERDPNNFVYSNKTGIEKFDESEFYRLADASHRDRVAYSHATTLIPSIVLEFLGKLNAKLGKDVKGYNLRMNSRFYSEPQIGAARIDIYDLARKGRGNRVKYEFEGVFSQDGIPRVSSTITCMGDGELDTKALLRN